MERDEELSRLDAVLAGCRRGAGGAALVSGAVASGKTELLHAFTERAVAAGALYFEAGRHLGDPAGLTEGLLRGLELFVEETGRPGPGVPARPRPGEAGPPAAETARRLHAQLLALAEREPVVVGVDDTHRVPPAALRDLLGVARRLRTAPVMMIFTDAGAAHPGHGVLHEELSRLPGTPLLRMRPLSLDGAFRLFARRLGAERAGRLAARGLAVTGGSPLLLRGLLADQRENGTGAADRLEVGAGFEHAVLDCLGRGDEDARRLAAAVAVLGDAATAPLAAELLGWSEPALAATLDALGRAGLLDAMRFRHLAARAAVLTAMDADERTGLHLRAARLLYRKGARAADVAHHVTAASHWVALEHLAQEGNSGAAGETMTSRAD
ncbi:AAA family ATPase [Actinomadura sp. WMMB 499]|uniref:AAA family ATPase n=1 Tax=Actinomadura sp. WMMB 499 TaxID=1219491 RepID=UPI00159DDEEB|nr:AAA family ATPase [Actinomadura sp. WMMB 499]